MKENTYFLCFRRGRDIQICTCVCVRVYPKSFIINHLKPKTNLWQVLEPFVHFFRHSCFHIRAHYFLYKYLLYLVKNLQSRAPHSTRHIRVHNSSESRIYILWVQIFFIFKPFRFLCGSYKSNVKNNKYNLFQFNAQMTYI